MSQSKTCTKCNTDKPLEDFYDNPRGKLGKSAWCIKCLKHRQRKLYHQRKKYGSPQTLARRAVQNALKKGLLKPGKKCAYPGCASGGPFSFHHWSYLKEHWLMGDWMCRAHHDQADHYIITWENVHGTDRPSPFPRDWSEVPDGKTWSPADGRTGSGEDGTGGVGGEGDSDGSGPGDLEASEQAFLETDDQDD